MMPACVIAGVVIVGDCVDVPPGHAPAGSIALASPKSSTFTVPSVADLDVGRLQIAVDDALLVRRLECLGDLSRDRQRLVDWHRPVGEAIARASPFDQLHDERVATAGRFEAVDRARCAGG